MIVAQPGARLAPSWLRVATAVLPLVTVGQGCSDGNNTAADSCYDCNNAPAAVLTVAVGGQILGEDDSVDFGRVAPLLQEAETFTLTNRGDLPLAITSIQISGGHYPDFEILASPASSGLDPRDSTTLVVGFRPLDQVIPTDSSEWHRTTHVTITTNDPAGPFSIRLSGTVGFVGCGTGDDTPDHRRCNLCLLDLTQPVQRYVDTYVRPFIADPTDKIAAITLLRDRMFMGSPLFLFGDPPAQAPWQLNPGEAFITALLGRLATVAANASLNNLQSQELLDAALADNTAVTILTGINARAARFSLPPFAMEELVALYGHYDRSTREYDKFVFTASDIIRYRLLNGCTSSARAFIALVKAMGIINRPEDLRYVATARAADYSTACNAGSPHGTWPISGHQVVLIRVDDRWRMVNTASNEPVRTLNADFDPTGYVAPAEPFANELIMFDCEIPAVPHLYRRIGADWNDGTCDNSFDNLMNIYSSGSYESPVCEWPDYP